MPDFNVQVERVEDQSESSRLSPAERALRQAAETDLHLGIIEERAKLAANSTINFKVRPDLRGIVNAVSQIRAERLGHAVLYPVASKYSPESDDEVYGLGLAAIHLNFDLGSNIRGEQKERMLGALARINEIAIRETQLRFYKSILEGHPDWGTIFDEQTGQHLNMGTIDERLGVQAEVAYFNSVLQAFGERPVATAEKPERRSYAPAVSTYEVIPESHVAAAPAGVVEFLQAHKREVAVGAVMVLGLLTGACGEATTGTPTQVNLPTSLPAEASPTAMAPTEAPTQAATATEAPTDVPPTNTPDVSPTPAATSTPEATATVDVSTVEQPTYKINGVEIKPTFNQERGTWVWEHNGKIEMIYDTKLGRPFLFSESQKGDGPVMEVLDDLANGGYYVSVDELKPGDLKNWLDDLSNVYGCDFNQAKKVVLVLSFVDNAPADGDYVSIFWEGGNERRILRSFVDKNGVLRIEAYVDFDGGYYAEMNPDKYKTGHSIIRERMVLAAFAQTTTLNKADMDDTFPSGAIVKYGFPDKGAKVEKIGVEEVK